jgi:hypothetical protein
MSTQYRLVQSGKTASGGCSAGQGSSELLRHGFIINKRGNNYVPLIIHPVNVAREPITKRN